MISSSLAVWLETISTGGQVQRLNAGQYLFSQGDPALSVFAVKTGRVCLLRHLQSGMAVPVHTALPGETLAEPALFSQTYHCDAVASEASEVIAYSKNALLDAIQPMPGLSFALIECFARQIHGLRGRIELRNIRSARERVLRFLELSAKDGTVVFERALKDIALELGLTHEAFYRTLSALAREGVITRLHERAVRLED